MPLGASLGVVTLNGRMFITLRYRQALFDAAAATSFLAGFERELRTPQEPRAAMRLQTSSGSDVATD